MRTEIKARPVFLLLLAMTGSSIAFAVDNAHPCWGTKAKQDVFSIETGDGNSERASSYFYHAPTGYRICWATTNEIGARPKNAPYRFTKKTRYSTGFVINVGCPEGGISSELIGAAVGTYFGGKEGGAAGGRIAKFLGSATGQSCNLGNGNNWWEGNVVAILFPDNDECPMTVCQNHPRPWERFPD
jgi:hypothetical protein